MRMQLQTAVMVLFAGIALPAHAADRLVRLQVPSPVMKDIAALPLIAGPMDEAERKINMAVARLDGSVRKAAAQCKSDAGTSFDWQRSVTSPMRGPRFISYEIVDSYNCGGAHPNSSTMSIVYDLVTGSPVDWSTLLPASLTGKLALASGADGTKMVTLSGQTLYALYLAAYRPSKDSGKAEADDEECREAVSQAGESGTAPSMMAWLDAKKGRLVVQFDLAHVAQACADEVSIPAAALREVGAQAVLVDALTKAHGSP